MKIQRRSGGPVTEQVKNPHALREMPPPEPTCLESFSAESAAPKKDNRNLTEFSAAEVREGMRCRIGVILGEESQ